MPGRNQRTQQLVLAALFTAMTAICAQIQIPLPPVPISLALLSVLLCGALLAPRYALYAMLGYALLGALGVPVFSGFGAGPSALFGPTGGYILGYALCAPAVALLKRRLGAGRLPLCMTLGLLVCYALGTAWFAFLSGCGAAAALSACVLPFLPGDLLKIALAALLARRISRAL